MAQILKEKYICSLLKRLHTGLIKATFLFCAYANTFAYAATNENQVQAADNDYVFDPTLFKGGNFDQASLEILSQPNSISPGRYDVDLYVNQVFIGNYPVTYIMEGSKVLPCLSPELINDISIKGAQNLTKNSKEQCLFLEQIAPKATSKTDLSIFRLDITIPQALLNIRPRGFVNPESYDTGANLGFINYLANYYHVDYSDKKINNLDSAWVSINGGVNLGTWQYRQLSTANWSKDSGYDWNNIRSYVQRPIASITSQFMAGQLVTNGRFFSGMSYNGVNFSTADAMLPESVRGYAPVIKGIATSNARVTVRQNGQEIYQTTVPPGDFEINDLYPTSYSGDLQVQVTETDGTVKTFIVPFSSVPESMRAGVSRYNIAIGQARNTQKKTSFGDITYQLGLTNSITANGGLRFAQNYIAAVIGGVHSNSFGAFGLDTTFSQAKLHDDETTKGWMGHASWSKTFQPIGTTVSLASYRYSTSGYRELTEVLGARGNDPRGSTWLDYTSSQRSRFDVTLSQSLGDYGNTFISAATQDYRDGRSRDTQLQLGYSQTFGQGVSMNISLARQRIGSYGHSSVMETATSISFSIPLSGNNPQGVNLGVSYNHSKSAGDQYQATASGMMDKEQSTNYSLSMTRDQQKSQTTVGGSLQKRLPKASLGMNASTGKGYWQASGNIQGAVAVHGGGVTFGPYLGDTFALVEAKGAEGASLFTSAQTQIDSNGYALIPSVTPYRYNNISIDPQGMKGNAEIIDSQKRIVPVAGSSVKVKFQTRMGTALLIRAITKNGLDIPMGTQVYDEQNEPIGITGQGGQIYVRVEKPVGTLTARWGDSSCYLPYQLSENDEKKSLANIVINCQPSLQERSL